MTGRTLKILLWMQVFYVVLGVALYYGLKHVRLAARAEKSCAFASMVGAPVDEGALIKTGRPYIVLPPAIKVKMNADPTRINVRTDDAGIVTGIRCG